MREARPEHGEKLLGISKRPYQLSTFKDCRKAQRSMHMRLRPQGNYDCFADALLSMPFDAREPNMTVFSSANLRFVAEDTFGAIAKKSWAADDLPVITRTWLIDSDSQVRLRYPSA